MISTKHRKAVSTSNLLRYVPPLQWVAMIIDTDAWMFSHEEYRFW